MHASWTCGIHAGVRWALSAGLALYHLFSLCNSYFRGFPQPQHLAELPPPPPPRLLQIVLAFGNYMNSSKRGAAYGFRLQSLDAVRGRGKEGSPGPGAGGWLVAWGLQEVLTAAAGDEVDRPQADAAALPGEGHC